MLTIDEKQKIEVNYWRDSADESPDSNSIYNIVNKAGDAQVLLDVLERYRDTLPSCGRVLELGAGQGWASCIYKRVFAEAHVIATDISEFAIASVSKWERIFGARVDRAYACKSYEIPEPDESVDAVFCFASAHHFLAHRRTLNEIARVLKHDGRGYYFYEPTSPRYLYRLAHWRLNRVRSGVPEDVLILSELRRLAHAAGLELTVDYYPSVIKRSPVAAVYYSVLRQFRFLQRVFPCSVNLVFRKCGDKAAASRGER